MAPHARRVKRPKFEPEIVQKALVNMLTIHELPFAVVERDEVKNTIETAFPGFRIPSSETMTWDCFQLFMDEKLKLKSFIKMMKQRVCLSLDTWKTNQSVTYLCITAHFIDDDWNLHKKVIGFSPICSDNGEEIGQVIEECLHDWEINHVLAVSAGKASSYDAAVTYLGTRFANPVMGGKFLRLKCLVDLTDTMIKEVLKDYEKIIESVRGMIRYVIQSPSRIRMFEQRARDDGIVSKSFLTLDCASRWTSTLEMLQVFKKFEYVFDWYAGQDPSYVNELSNTCGVLHYSDWERVHDVIYFLRPFRELNEKISGSRVTSNMFLDEIDNVDFHLDSWGLRCTRNEVTSNMFLNEIDNVDFHLDSWGLRCTRNEEPEHVSRAFELIWNSDEYFGDVENSNMLIYVASILDPRSKTNCMEFYFANTKYRYNSPHEGNPYWKKKAEWVVACIYDLFNEYVAKTEGQHQTAKFQTSGYMSYLYRDTGPRGLFQKRVLGFGGNARCKSEIDIYLNEDEDFEDSTYLNEDEDFEDSIYLNEDGDFEDSDGFDILLWWKVNSERFPVLSRMAKDVLAIPIAAVALESDINIDGNLLDDFRSSLSPPMVEALVCTQDWLNNSKKQIKGKKGSTKLADKILKGVYEQLEAATSECG